MLLESNCIIKKLFLLYLHILISFVQPSSESLHLTLYENHRKYEVNSEDCSSGVYFKTNPEFTCVCIRGVWGFYEKFCRTPLFIAGGEDHCYKFGDDITFSIGIGKKIRQIVPLGHRFHPFIPSLVTFRERLSLQTSVTTFTSYGEQIDPSSSFLAIGSQDWTLFGLEKDKDERIVAVCLRPSTEGKKFCHWGKKGQIKEIDNWAIITGIRKGCSVTEEVVQDGQECRDIMPMNDESICFKEDLITTTGLSTTFKDEVTEISTTPQEEFQCRGDIRPEDVKKYWNDLQNTTSCPKGITQVRFRDQLNRLALKLKNEANIKREISLFQAEAFLKISIEGLAEVICPAEFVPPEFFEATSVAFHFFIQEDFFFGFNELDETKFNVSLMALSKCIKDIQQRPLIEFESVEIPDCPIRKITRAVKIDGKREVIDIPEGETWRKFEPLIEVIWKVFLNVQSICCDSFPNYPDHQRYVRFMMQLFTRSIYEKWLEPPDPILLKLYKFIVPYHKFFAEIMTNIDYCTGSTALVIKKYPVWLQRSSYHGESIAPFHGMESHDRNSNKRKRSTVWTNFINEGRKASKILNGKAFCLNEPDAPTRLGFETCPFPV